MSIINKVVIMIDNFSKSGKILDEKGFDVS